MAASSFEEDSTLSRIMLDFSSVYLLFGEIVADEPWRLFYPVIIDFFFGSSGVPGGWCWVVRRKLLFRNDLWRKAGHSVYRTQVTEIK
jgi:hypothetical protein